MSLMVNFVAFAPARDACLMVLVEEGPWLAPLEDELRRLQDRLFSCLSAALDGELAKQFPESRGKTIIVQVDCYDLPREPIDEFISRFSAGVRDMADYSAVGSDFVREWKIEINHEALPSLH